MTHLALAMFEGVAGLNPQTALFFFLSIGALALFGVFLPISKWTDNRRIERKAYYQAEMLRRVAESSGEGAKAVIDLLHEQDRIKATRMREGLKVGGLINIGFGLALLIFLRTLLSPTGGTGAPNGVYLCGLIPAFIGVAMLVYVFFVARPIE